ncbi:MAG: hypothetical protein JSV62_04840 [Promethearchaeota archaeon]|nr:MAG: hypothetical protein JSV62_04840 [Candidatus Lokiarchaeota archaeon]
MSKAIIWQYNDFIQSRKEKLVKMLIIEIIFLKTKVKKIQNSDEIYHLQIALEKLDYLLIRLKKNSSDIKEEDFDKIIMLIYQIFKDITDNLENKVKV